MTTTKKLNALKINKLTEAQLAAATVSEDELYLVTDAENPVTVKTDSTLSGDGSAAKPLSVSPEVVATSVKTTSDSGLSFLDKDGSQMWNMSGRILFSGYVGEGQTIGQIGTIGSTLDAVYAVKLCKDSTELSVREGKTGDIAITSELPEAKTGTAGQVYTKTETGAEWQDAPGGGGGDYLPLSGGTLTGPITIKQPSPGATDCYINWTDSSGLEIKIDASVANERLSFVVGSHMYIMSYDGFYTERIGCESSICENVYTKKLNNGADINVPTTGGTMALVEDIDAAVGNISTALTAILGE